MDNELDRRLARIEMGIAQLRGDMERQTNHLGAIVELLEVMAKPEEVAGESLGTLLQQLIDRLDRVAGLSVETLAAVTQLGASLMR